MSKENIDEYLVSIKHLLKLYEVYIYQIYVEVEYRSFCLAYHQVYDENESLKLNEVLKFMISREVVSLYPNVDKYFV